MPKISGACLCGQVRYESPAEPEMTAICHCPDCQRQTGTSFSIVVGFPRAHFDVRGEAAQYTTTGESGALVHRYFCANCGSPLYTLPDALPDIVFIKAGTLDDASWLEPQAEFFCDTAQPWVALEGGWERAPRNPPLG